MHIIRTSKQPLQFLDISESWNMSFMIDRLVERRRLRLLDVIDDNNLESM